MARIFARKRDFLVLLALVLAGAAGLLLRGAPDGAADVYAVVEVNGAGVCTVALEHDCIFAVPGREQVRIEVKDGRVAFVESDCPDKVCIHSGYLGRPGQSAACLPNRVVLKIVGAHDAGGVDAVTS